MARLERYFVARLERNSLARSLHIFRLLCQGPRVNTSSGKIAVIATADLSPHRIVAYQGESMWTIAGAIIAVGGVLIGAYVTNFVAEDYRKFRQKIIIAAGLAGELESHALALPLIRNALLALLEASRTGQKIIFPSKFDVPTDPIYEKVVGDFGLLGRHLTRDIVFTYQNIRAFRVTFSTVTEAGAEMPPEMLQGALESCLMSLSRAEEKATPLLAELSTITQENYRLRLGRIRIEIIERDRV